MLGALHTLLGHRSIPEDSRHLQTAGKVFAVVGPRREDEARDISHLNTGSGKGLNSTTDAPQENSKPATRHRLSKDGSDSEQLTSLLTFLSNPVDYVNAHQEFLRDNRNEYGYGGQVEIIRREEFRRLNGQAYLDHAGAALYSERQIQACSDDLLTTLLFNPHSAPNSASADTMVTLRRETLDLLNADGREYEVVITGGATAALKLVAECFPWRAGASRLVHPAAVHNSMLGMRGIALAAGAAFQLVQLNVAVTEAMAHVNSVDRPPPPNRAVAVNAPMEVADRAVVCGGGAAAVGVECVDPVWNLLALPVECNFTGDREPLADVIRHVKAYGIVGMSDDSAARPVPHDDSEGRESGKGRDSGGGRWLVLLDAAKACATKPPDLSVIPADFVVLSYYKIFGHPTGLGALVVRKEALALLSAGKVYFGGGTVEVSVADRPYFVRRGGAAGLEDGTPPFTSISAARHGFTFLRRLGGLPAVHHHSRCLARWLVTHLATLRHANGGLVCILYGKWCAAVIAAIGKTAAAMAVASGDDDDDVLPDHGPTVSFNLLRSDGSWVGYSEVGRLAAMHGLVLRTGCFCNPGACSEWLGLSSEDLIRHHSAGHVCWDDQDLLNGRPTGAVRVSLGASSSFSDVHSLVQLVRKYFLDDDDGSGILITGNDGSRGGGGGCKGVSDMVVHGFPNQGAGEESCPLDRQREWQSARLQPAATAATAAVGVAAVGEAMPQGHQQLRQQSCTELSSRALDQPPGCSAPSGAPCYQGTAILEPTAVPLQLGSSSSTHNRSDSHGSMAVESHTGISSSQGAANAGGSCCSCSGTVGRLSRILLFPVKSCAPQEVTAWPIGPTGLLYDREWALVDDSCRVVTLKQCPRMALVRPIVDLTHGSLTIHAPDEAGVKPLEFTIPDLFRSRNQCADKALDAAAGRAGAGAVEAAVAQGTAEVDVQSLTSAVCCSGSGSPPDDVAKGQSTLSSTTGRHIDAVHLDSGLTMERVLVCGDTVCSDLVGVFHDSARDARVRQWFVRVLGVPCRIVQQRAGARKVRRPAGQQSGGQHATALEDRASQQPQSQVEQQPSERDTPREAGAGYQAAVEPSVGFANDGQYLLVSEASMADLRSRLLRNPGHGAASLPAAGSNGSRGGCSAGTSGMPGDGDDLLTRLRPNLVVSGFAPYEEDSWGKVLVGPLHADVLGTCPRCELLQVDPRVGVRRGAELLIALAQYRRRCGGRVQFGVLLAMTVSSKSDAGANIASNMAGTSPGDENKETANDLGAVLESKHAGQSMEDFVEWLQREFGALSIVTIGDPVRPTALVVEDCLMARPPGDSGVEQSFA